MRIGIWLDDEGRPYEEVDQEARKVADGGFASIWLAQRNGWDPLALFAALGRDAPGVELGTAVVRTMPQHPIALASQALTVQAATGNRLTLGLGASHRPLIEGMYGLPFEKPALHMREYLTALRPLLRGEVVSYEGKTLTANTQLIAPGAKPPQVLIAAHGPVMLRIAGELTDGVLNTWVGPGGVEKHLVPPVLAAAPEGAKPRIVVSTLVSVSSDPAAKRAWVEETYGIAATMPSYRRTLDWEGASGVGDVVLAGDEEHVVRELRHFAEAGTTDLVGIPFGDVDEIAHTTALLAEISKTAGSG